MPFETIFSQVTANDIIDLIFTILILVALNFFAIQFMKRKALWISEIVLSCLYLFCYILALNSMKVLFLFLMLVFLFIGIMTNLAEFRSIFANKESQRRNDRIIGIKKKDKETKVDKIYDHEGLYKTLNSAVLYLSKNRIGALITIQRKDDLSNIMKNGTSLDCPVSAELLETIYYTGTRLHDGAVVIKDDRIVAASVYYTPTTKALPGKYGSRHRAAMGISEICDAITIVVSEETGKISLAYNGNLDSYNPDNFLTALTNVMTVTENMSEESEK